MLNYRALLVSVLFLFLAACGNESNVQQEEPTASSEDVKRETAEAYHALEAYARSKKDQFVKQAEATLQSYEQRIGELRTRAEEAGGEAKKKLETAMQEWEAKKQMVTEKIEEMKTAGAERWQETEQQVDAAIEELKQAYDQARSSVS